MGLNPIFLMKESWQKKFWSGVLISWIVLVCLGGWYVDKQVIVVIALAAMNTILLAYIWYINASGNRCQEAFHKKDREKERMVTNLAIAEKIQKQLLPASIPHLSGLDCYVRSRPSEEMGGDFYQIIQPDQRRVLFAMGDVAGHGLPSGIISIMIDTLFYTFSQQSLSLIDILVEINKVLYKRIDPSLFASMVLVAWDKEKHTLTMVSAGFGYLFHWQNKRHQVEKVKGGGMALGMIEDIRSYLKEKVIDFEPEDSLIVSTDGISDICNEHGERLGVNRLKEWTAEHASQSSAQELFEALSKEITRFAPIQNPQDDLTLMVLKRLHAKN